MDNRYTNLSFDYRYVLNDKGDKVYIPTYVSSANRHHRYDNDVKVIQKQCINCSEWFDILKLEDSAFKDIHDESAIHRRSRDSGYDIMCKACDGKYYKTETKKTIENHTGQTKNGASEKNHEYSFYMKPTNKQFLHLIALINDKTDADVLNELIERECNNFGVEKLLNYCKKNL